MKCPRTGENLKVVKVGGIEVEISEACGGVFFDNFELEKFDEKSEKRGEVLVEHLKNFPPPALDQNERIKCPKCTDVVMARHFYSPLKQIEVDRCPGCGGFWFDFGELDKLRNLFPDQKDREKLSKEFENEMLNSTMYKVYDKKLNDKQASIDSARKLSRVNKLSSLIFDNIW